MLEYIDNPKFQWLIVAGHGGIKNGEYVTPGKRSPIWSDGRQLFEGVSNRKITQKIIEFANKANLIARMVNNTQDDWTLTKRAFECNGIAAASDIPCRNIFIHSNGHSNEAAHGWECFTSPGVTKADKMATLLYKHMQNQFPGRKMRTSFADGDPDKEANFTVLKRTSAPSILSENFFMTNQNECQEILLCPTGIAKIALAHVEMMVEYEILNK